MLFKKYQDFFGNYRIDENVQQAKNYLKKRALSAKKEKSGEENVSLTPEEQRRAESDPNFLKIKELLHDNPGYVYAFTKFFYDEEVPFDELKQMYDRIKENKSVISNLPMTVDKYADVVPTNDDPRKGFERLGDDITKLEEKRIVKKFVDRLPGDFVVTNPNARDRGASVASIKRAYQNAPAATKEKVAGIAKAFNEFGKESDGTVDLKKNAELQDLFFNKIKRYRSLNEVIQAALSFIKAANNDSIVKFLKNVDKVNEKYGEMNGAEIVYDEKNILIIEIKSYQANKDLNANTSHCIASSSYQWDNYVGGDSNYNKQYYIYNFNLSPGDDKSVIGITIEPGYRIRACHLKSDAGFSGQIKGYMDKIGVPFEVLAPMTPEEVEKKKKRVIANKEIIKANLSVENCKRYIEEGADPNAQQGKPLINAVTEDNVEKVHYLIEMGAHPNIGSAIKYAKNLEMIKILVSYGATLTNEVFNQVSKDYDAIKYLIDAGMDVNFDNGYPLRTAVKNLRMDIMKLLIEAGADITQRRYMVIKWASEFGSTDILSFLIDKLKENEFKVPEDKFKDWMHWNQTSDKSTPEQKKEVEKLLKDRMKDFK